MSDSKSQDHWKALALLLDVDLPAEPEPSEEPSGENLLDSPSSEAGQGDAEDRDLADDRSPQTPDTAEATGTAEATEPPSTPRPPARSRPRPKPATVDTSHWRGLAGELGIEVPVEEEPEPVPEPVETEPELEPFDESADDDSQQSAVIMPFEPQGSDSEPEVDVEAAEVEFDDFASDDFASDDAEDSPPSPPAVAARKTPSIFEDDNFSIDTPGALDRVFDDSWADDEPSASPTSVEQRDAFVAFPEDEDEDEGEDEGEDESEDATDDTDVKLQDDAEDSAEIDASAPDTAGSDEPRRRRRRRRRRKKTAGDGEVQQADETAQDDSQDAEQEVVQVTEAVDSALDLDDDHHDDITEDDDDDLSTASVKHRKIPTWDEAVALVISNNMESRARNPGNGNRGRGRGRGRRS